MAMVKMAWPWGPRHGRGGDGMAVGTVTWLWGYVVWSWGPRHGRGGDGMAVGEMAWPWDYDMAMRHGMAMGSVR